MWIPKKEGIEELVCLFQHSLNPSNVIQIEVYNKIQLYSQQREFPFYLLYILNCEDIPKDLRQISGLTLKGILDSSETVTEEFADYFKRNIFQCFFHIEGNIRKTVSNLISSYIKSSGIDSWPEVIEMLCSYLENPETLEISLSTLNFLLEDSEEILNKSNASYVKLLSLRLMKVLTDCIKGTSFSSAWILEVFKTLTVLLENCPHAIEFENFIGILLNFLNGEDKEVIPYVEKCLLIVIKLNLIPKQVQVENFVMTIFDFYIRCLNALTVDFLLCIIEDENLIKSQSINDKILVHLEVLTPFIYDNLILKDEDIIDLDNKFHNEDNEDIESVELHLVLRKSCCKLLDYLSLKHPNEVYSLVQPRLDQDILSDNWRVKEKAILALGVIGVGCYSNLLPCLNNLVLYMLHDVNQQKMFSRSTTCWCLSRFASYIVKDATLYKEFLKISLIFIEINDLKLNESAFSSILTLVEEGGGEFIKFLPDSFEFLRQSIRNETYTTKTLELIYHLLTTYSNEVVRSYPNFINELMNDIIKVYIKLIDELMQGKTYSSDNLMTIIRIIYLTIATFPDIHSIMSHSIFSPSFKILQVKAEKVMSDCGDDSNDSNDNIVNELLGVILKLYTENNEIQTQYTYQLNECLNIFIKVCKFKEGNTIPLLGELCRVDPNLMDIIRLNFLMDNIELKNTNGIDIENDNTIIVIHAIKALGQNAKVYSELNEVLNKIISKLSCILSLPRTNKILSQNVAVCLGRIGMYRPDTLSNVLNCFLKQICLSLRTFSDCLDKEEAFIGICRSIAYNPSVVGRNLFFFCEALSLYKPQERLETILRELFAQLKSNWIDNIWMFPESVKVKTLNRFYSQS